MRGWAAVSLLAVPLAATAAYVPPCIPACDVAATFAAFVPPAVVVQSGGTLTWASADGITHTATSIAGAGATPCLHLSIPTSAPRSASFRIENGSLQVLRLGDPFATWRECPEATGQPAGGFVLLYECLFHPLIQKGAVLVRRSQ